MMFDIETKGVKGERLTGKIQILELPCASGSLNLAALSKRVAPWAVSDQSSGPRT